MAFEKKPAHRVRIGTIGGSIFAQQTSKGVMYNTTFTRSYQNSQTAQWEDSYSFGSADVCVLCQVAALCLSWIVWREAENAKGNFDRGGEEQPPASPPPPPPPPPPAGRKSKQQTIQETAPVAPAGNPGSNHYYEGYEAY